MSKYCFQLHDAYVFRLRDAQLYQMQVSSWMVHMESSLSKGGTLVDDLNSRCVLFIKVTRESVSSIFQPITFIFSIMFSYISWGADKENLSNNPEPF